MNFIRKGNDVSTHKGLQDHANVADEVTDDIQNPSISAICSDSLADFVKHDPTVGSNCTNIQANVNIYVGIIK